MKINREYIYVPAVLIVTALVTWLLATRLNASDNPVQNYTPSRFVLLSAELNVSSLQTAVPNTRKVVIQSDTVTGQCWVLELMIPSTGNFHVASARWRPVTPPQVLQYGN
ncbi:MAG: hypothetical protein IJY46_10180 [Lentisphaeria bacterium]|nr:hypothetical protein [Lentisphaeria bacterium]